ncbi:MAG: histone deacetylase [Proteobacteria bacterium]|nr:histone deacetylase [Pseudomonadota bacterium]
MRPDVISTPQRATWDQLSLVHSGSYLEALRAGCLSQKAARRIGLPATRSFVDRARRVVGGTVEAARLALVEGRAANLAGGTHHAFADRGEAFCFFHDVAVAVGVLRREGRLGRVLVVDLDVHQGDGSAALFAGDADAVTLSLHGARNYPFHKPPSTFDVALPDGTEDEAYLAALEAWLPRALARARPDLVFYLAGVDPFRDDRLGRLALSRAGLARRDRFVLESLREDAVPVVILPAGGYGPTAEQTAELHAIVHREARRVFGPHSRALAPRTC